MSNVNTQSLVDRQVKEHKKMEAWFEERVRKYERVAETSPGPYRTRVRLFGWLGYGYILLVLLVLLGFIGLIVYAVVASRSGSAIGLKLAIIAGIVVVAIARALWVKFDKPEGVSVSRTDAPALWRDVEKIAKAVNAPGPEEIRINADLNAAAYQRPRLGILGWYQNILLLGMPLLLTMSPDEARSVIAHEYGHFSGQHGRFGAWAYRVNQTWGQLRENIMRAGGSGAWIFGWFVKWFSPRFAAMTFALRRRHEYEADQAAAGIAGAQTAATALMRLSYLDDHIQKSFWTPFYEKVRELPQPPANSFASMPSTVLQAASSDDVRGKLELALRGKTDYDDTHPSLSDRLKSLKQLPTNLDETIARLSEPQPISAAAEFFGDNLARTLGRLEEEHVKAIREAWGREHARVAEQKRLLVELEGITQPDETQEVNRAGLTYGLKGVEAGEPLIRAAMEKYPKNAAPKFWMGEILLDRDDPAGIPFMREAISLDRDWQDDGLSAIANFYYRNGRMDDLANLKSEALVSYAEVSIAEQASWNLTLGDLLLPPNLTPEQSTAVKDAMSPVKGLQSAYVVKRVLPGTGQEVYCVLVFPVKKLIESGKESAELIEAVANAPTFPFEAKIFSPPDPKAWKKRLEQVSGAIVFERSP
jgi:Zn-dependent protease with chaperone function